MAKHSSAILALARKGAEHKYQELKTEIAELVKLFPHLRTQLREATKVTPSPRESTPAAVAEPKVRRRRRKAMSAAARKAVSVRMKKYWAARKAAAKK